jgi:hypothetical protein
MDEMGAQQQIIIAGAGYAGHLVAMLGRRDILRWLQLHGGQVA